MEKRGLKISDLGAVLVFCLFALCLLLVLLTGARSYAGLVRRGESAFDRRTAAQYVTTRVHQADCAGGVSVGSFGDCQALILRQEIEGEVYLTRIYCFDGWLRELFAAQSGAFSPEDGEALLRLSDISFDLEGNRLSAALTLPGGETETLILCLRSAGEVAP